MERQRSSSRTEQTSRAVSGAVDTKQAYRIELVRIRIAEPGDPVASPAAIARRFAHLQRFDRERLIRLDLDNRNRIVGEELVAIGTANAALISPREVFRGALLNGARRVVVLHNHPAGDPTPSADDRAVWEKLAEAGEMLGIPVLDFLIIGEDRRYWSGSDNPP